jgi:pantoate kinase
MKWVLALAVLLLLGLAWTGVSGGVPLGTGFLSGGGALLVALGIAWLLRRGARAIT